MEWDFKDQLYEVQKKVSCTPGEGAYYLYDANGQRTEKLCRIITR